MRVTVRVRPGASRTRVGGRWGAEEVLGVSVGARAVDGAATAAVRAAVAQAFGVRARDVSLVAGERSRTKVLEVDVDDATGRGILVRLLADDRPARGATSTSRSISSRGWGGSFDLLVDLVP